MEKNKSTFLHASFSSCASPKACKLNPEDNRKIDIKPIVKYANADVDKIKFFVDNRNKVGVYRWVNNKNGNTYVGSSSNLSVRFYTYYSLGSLAKSNRPIDRARRAVCTERCTYGSEGGSPEGNGAA